MRDDTVNDMSSDINKDLNTDHQDYQDYQDNPDELMNKPKPRFKAAYGFLLVLLVFAVAMNIFAPGGWLNPPADPPSDWQPTVQAAFNESTATGKPVLAVFSASWCPPCQYMVRNVWPDPAVANLIAEGYVPVYVDADAPENMTYMQQYDVMYLPSVMVLDENGKVLKRQDTMMQQNEAVLFLASAGS